MKPWFLMMAQVGKSVWTTLQKDVSRNSVLLHIGACRQVGPKLEFYEINYFVHEHMWLRGEENYVFVDC